MQEDVIGAEGCEGAGVEFAVVVAGGGQEARPQALQDALAEVLEDVEGGLLEEVAEPLGELEEEADGGLEVVFRDEVAEGEEQVRGHGVGEVEAGFQVGVFGQLGAVCREGGGVVGGHVPGDGLAGSEVYVLVHLTRKGERGRREGYVESGEVVLDDCGVVEAYDAIVDCLVGGGVSVCVRMAA